MITEKNLAINFATSTKQRHDDNELYTISTTKSKTEHPSVYTTDYYRNEVLPFLIAVSI